MGALRVWAWQQVFYRIAKTLGVFSSEYTEGMELNVSQPWLRLIQNGQKTVEGRLNKGKFADIKVGTVLVISGNSNSNSKKTVAVTTRVCRYASFEEYLSQEGLARTLPGIKSIKDGVDVYRKFYSAEDERTHGVLAIHIVLTK
jgi:ASC-1-like (ASCH) protein